MGQSLSQLCVHLIFGTEQRALGSPLQGSVLPAGPVTLGVAQGCVSSAPRASQISKAEGWTSCPRMGGHKAAWLV
jgi:hypothetical protein